MVWCLLFCRFLIAFNMAMFVACFLLLVRNVWGHVYSNEEEVIDTMKGLIPLLALSTTLDGLQAVLSGIYISICIHTYRWILRNISRVLGYFHKCLNFFVIFLNAYAEPPWRKKIILRSIDHIIGQMTHNVRKGFDGGLFRNKEKVGYFLSFPFYYRNHKILFWWSWCEDAFISMSVYPCFQHFDLCWWP